MAKKQNIQEKHQQSEFNDYHEEEMKILKRKTIKELIAPSGIDASNIDHLEIISNTRRFARSFFVSSLPRMCSFPELFRDMYMFGDINTSIYINPVKEEKSQNELNRVINELETERIVAYDKGNINRESTISQKRYEAEKLRDEIAAGFNKLFEASIISTIYTYSLEDLERQTKMLSSEMAKSMVGIKTAWGIQEDALKSNLPFMNNKINKTHTFDRNSMGTVFPFTTSEVGHPSGVPLGFNKQTGTPILFDNFHSSLTNYNMVIFAKSGAGKSVTMKTLISRSSVLMGIESLALDAEGEYTIVAESLGGINVVISPTSKTVINLFDLEVENVKDEITGKERAVLSIENKVEDVTQALVTMARGSTRSDEVNELTKQIIAESVAEEYAALEINSDPESLYVSTGGMIQGNIFSKVKKDMPTIGSWYKRIEQKARENTNKDYQYHYSYLLKVMKQYIREYDGQMAYFDGQSTFDLLDGTLFINLDISQLEERFARPLAQQILLAWIWEKYVKKNSEDRTRAAKKRVLVDEAWMLLPYPEAVDFLNTMARRARKRNVSLAIISQRFQDFYERPEAQAVLTSSDTKLLWKIRQSVRMHKKINIQSVPFADTWINMPETESRTYRYSALQIHHYSYSFSFFPKPQMLPVYIIPSEMQSHILKTYIGT